MVTLKAMIQQKPAPGARNEDGLHINAIQATADNYDLARLDLEAQVPDDWRMLWLMRA